MTTSSERHLLLSVDGLHVRAGATGAPRTLVRDVNFTLAPGETLGIVGESGSGKTMVARSVTGILPDGVRSEGRVNFLGKDILGLSDRAMRPLRGDEISIVLQDPFTALNPLQTVGQTLAESLAPQARRNRATRKAEVARRLQEVGLDPERVAGKHPFQLSGGMRQRVAIAAALARDPKLLIADEPTTALDATTQADVLALLQRLQQERGMALVLITHDLRVAFSVCDRILVMYAGAVVEDAPARELMALPEHPYSLGLKLAEPPVSHRVEQLVSIPGRVPAADTVAHTCAFVDRCAWRTSVCEAERPLLHLVGEGRLSACVRIPEIRGEINQRQTAVAKAAPVRSPAEDRPAVLSVRGLAKSYRTTSLTSRARTSQAVKGVSFAIGDGESVGLVGETGSGKTTIARCILGLARPTSGTIAIGDLDVSDRSRLSREERKRAPRLVQVVFQDPYASLNPMLTIGAALAEAVMARGEGGDAAGEVQTLLKQVGLPPSYVSRKPAALSGGERQRVAIARALAVRPRLLICDEPVAALDVSVQAQVLELLRDVRKQQGVSMLFITHDLAVVRQMTDRSMVLYQGEIVEDGETDNILDNPQHSYTQRLVASVPGEA